MLFLQTLCSHLMLEISNMISVPVWSINILRGGNNFIQGSKFAI